MEHGENKRDSASLAEELVSKTNIEYVENMRNYLKREFIFNFMDDTGTGFVVGFLATLLVVIWVIQKHFPLESLLKKAPW